ncbi:hypothetical protein AB0G74_30600 [Streptomyces sp. NPDC020875]|uniref:hypothetical protein n=1 Tax=Streptomyces sp. NPDC020875 TaxID=3154898 RepID=UPI003402D742
MDETTDPADRGQPATLTPGDEAMLARAQTLVEIAEAALRDIAQPYPADDRGALLRDALHLKALADELVGRAVTAERERGASWAEIGDAAEVTRQAAHERWTTRVGHWILLGRRRAGVFTGGDRDSVRHAADLDRWYTVLLPGSGDRPSGLLASLHDEDARAKAAYLRSEAEQLRFGAEKLRGECTAAYGAVMEASGTPTAEEKRAVWATRTLALAEVYDRLAAVEEPVATEHRRTAATHRSIARDILTPPTKRHRQSA